MRKGVEMGVVLLLIGLLAPPETARAGEAAARESIAAGSLILEPETAWKNASLTIAGPDGRRFERTYIAPEPIVFHGLDASGSPLADGIYRYEARLTPAEDGKGGARLGGRFSVVAGALRGVPFEGESGGRPSAAPEPRTVEDHTTGDRGTSQQICAGCTSGFEPGDQSFGGEGLTIIDSTLGPGIALIQNEVNTVGAWEVAVGEDMEFYVSDLDPGGTSFDRPFQIQDGAPDSALVVDQSGDVGVGTALPAANLHVVGGPGGNVAIVEGGALAVQRFDGISANIRFTAGGQAWLFQNQPTDGSFNIRDQTNSSTPVRVFPNGVGATLVVRNGRLGLRNTTPQHPIHAFNGARLTSGGVWANASSREAKRDIEALSADEARATLGELDPVKFAYRVDAGERHVGFIAEDVPELVASGDRKAVAAMDVVAVLARVVQEHEEEVERLRRRIDEQQTEMRELRELLSDRGRVAPAAD